jgi:choline dehydrogenase-like flavoprotein
LYASLSLEGSARLLPGGFLKYHFTKNDRFTLAKALAKSQELSFRMGASEVLIAGKDAVPSKAILNGWNTKNLDITAVHVTSSLPMGNLSSNPVDTLGAFKELENLFVIDGSILPDAPGVNPQGTIMAMASYLSENITRSIA